jgi:hypothetical protein
MGPPGQLAPTTASAQRLDQCLAGETLSLCLPTQSEFETSDWVSLDNWGSMLFPAQRGTTHAQSSFSLQDGASNRSRQDDDGSNPLDDKLMNPIHDYYCRQSCEINSAFWRRCTETIILL